MSRSYRPDPRPRPAPSLVIRPSKRPLILHVLGGLARSPYRSGGVTRTRKSREEIAENERLECTKRHKEHLSEKLGFKEQYDNIRAQIEADGLLQDECGESSPFPDYKEIIENIELSDLKEAEILYKPIIMISAEWGYKLYRNMSAERCVIGWKTNIIDALMIRMSKIEKKPKKNYFYDDGEEQDMNAEYLRAEKQENVVSAKKPPKLDLDCLRDALEALLYMHH